MEKYGDERGWKLGLRFDQQKDRVLKFNVPVSNKINTLNDLAAQAFDDRCAEIELIRETYDTTPQSRILTGA